MSTEQNEHGLILIIDDAVDSIRLLSAMLRDQAEIIFATSGAAGLELARTRRPPVILLDVEMHAMDGYEVCRRLKADIELRDSAIIFVTGHTTIDSEIAALEAGAVDFITKPLNQALVRARVRTHLRLQQALATLVAVANVDAMTGLYNRRYLDQQLEREYAVHRRQKAPLAVAFIDIDYFKGYNDFYGHQAGDACLREVGLLIGKATQRPGEVVARYGGEEFVVVLPYTALDKALVYAERLRRAIVAAAIAHANAGANTTLTVSIGVASMVPNGASSKAALLEQADQALYHAKASGRNCVSSSAQGPATS